MELTRSQLRQIIEQLSTSSGGDMKSKAVEKGREIGKQLYNDENVYDALYTLLTRDVALDVGSAEDQIDEAVGDDAMRRLTEFLKKDPVWSAWYRKTKGV